MSHEQACLTTNDILRFVASALIEYHAAGPFRSYGPFDIAEIDYNFSGSKIFNASLHAQLRAAQQLRFACKRPSMCRSHPSSSHSSLHKRETFLGIR